MLEEMVLGSNKFVSRSMVSLLGIALCLNLRPPTFKEGDRPCGWQNWYIDAALVG